MVARIVGVDIGRDMIRAVEVENADKARPVVVRHGAIGLPPGAVSAGEVRELGPVTAAVKKLWSTAGFKTKTVVIGMGNQRVLARDLTVPKMGIEQIRESLPFQVQEMLPVPVSEALLDFYPISEGLGEGGPVINGLLIAAIKESVMANIKAVKLGGLKTARVDLVPFALSRAFLRGPLGDATVALFDIGASTTNVVVATKGVPQFVRMIPAGGQDMTDALMTHLQVTAEQAEQIKQQRGISNAPVSSEIEQRAAQVMLEQAQQLVSNLRNTLNYYASSHPSEPVQVIALTGGAASLPGFAQTLSELVRLQVVSPDPFSTLDLSKSVQKATPFERQSMAAALGLALGSVA